MAADCLEAQHHPICYPSDAKSALSFFRKALQASAPNPLYAPTGGRLAGIIAPHIDFRVSLQAYATAFQPLMQVPLAETYIILGVGHRSRLEWNLDRRDYVSPLGRVACAGDLVDGLAAGSRNLFSPQAHVGEHSIEFALLWIQALHGLHSAPGKNGPRFVPILCGGLHAYVEGEQEWDDLEDLHRLGQNLGAILRDQGERVRVIVSIDGCHLGPRFHHPFQVTPALLQATDGWEKMLWACAARGNARELLEWFREEGNDRYFDGVGALALLLAAGEGKLKPQRTYYEQWFTEEDASAVTFSSGLVLA